MATDTEGCILVGTSKGQDTVSFKALFEKIETATKKEKIFIEVVGGSHEDVAQFFKLMVQSGRHNSIMCRKTDLHMVYFAV